MKSKSCFFFNFYCSFAFVLVIYQKELPIVCEQHSQDKWTYNTNDALTHISYFYSQGVHGLPKFISLVCICIVVVDLNLQWRSTKKAIKILFQNSFNLIASY